MTDREIFKRNLADLMKQTKTKQIDISRYMGVSYQTVSTWVTGRCYPRADAMEQLCKFFDVKLSALTEDHGGQETPEETLVHIYRILPDEGRDLLLQRAYELQKLCPKRGKKNAKG